MTHFMIALSVRPPSSWVDGYPVNDGNDGERFLQTIIILVLCNHLLLLNYLPG
jgi:hypothetical protein